MGNTYRRTLPENNQRLLNNNVNVDIIDQNEVISFFILEAVINQYQPANDQISKGL